MGRRRFLRHALAGAAAGLAGCASRDAGEAERVVMTVCGPVAPERLGRTLPHEHVVVDFIGADRISPGRYSTGEAFELILPHLTRLRESGTHTLVECTPAYLGRRPDFLLRLARASRMHVVTNTGWYAAVQGRYLPREAREWEVERIAGHWLDEWNRGIEGTGIRPGFIKLGADAGPLSDVAARLLRAAARVHQDAGLRIFLHSGDGETARDAVRILDAAGVAPSALAWVHAQNDPGPIQVELARQGAWISLDGFSLAPTSVVRHVEALTLHRDSGTLGRVLVSHDDGWLVDGEAPSGNRLTLFANGNVTPYTAIENRLLPQLLGRGFTPEDMDRIRRRNPQAALALPRNRVPRV